MIDFSKPIVTTRKGSPSESNIMLIVTPSLVVTRRPKRNAKMLDKSTDVANQKLEPNLFIDRNRDMNVKCMDKYPRVMMMISNVSACWVCQQKSWDGKERFAP